MHRRWVGRDRVRRKWRPSYFHAPQRVIRALIHGQRAAYFFNLLLPLWLRASHFFIWAYDISKSISGSAFLDNIRQLRRLVPRDNIREIGGGGSSSGLMLYKTSFSNLKLLAALWINLLSLFEEQIWTVVVVGAVALEMLEMLDLRLVG